MARNARLGTLVLLFLTVSSAWPQEGGVLGRGGLGGGGGGLRPPAPPQPAPVETVWLAVGPVSLPPDVEISGLVAVGPVTVAGKVLGDITSIGGKVSLAETAVVRGHVTAVCATVDRAEGATVAGEVRERTLEDVASTTVGWPGSEGAILRIGDVGVRRGENSASWVLALGGDVTVRKGAEVDEIVAFGGDLTIEEGADVRRARVIGGELRRPEGKARDEDEVLSGAVLPCSSTEAPESPAYRSSSLKIGQSSTSIQCRITTTGGTSARLDLTAQSVRGSVQIALGMQGIGRVAFGGPRPAIIRGRNDDYYRRWQASYTQFGTKRAAAQEVPEGSDPLFTESAAVGVGIRIVVNATDQQRAWGERTIVLGIPTGAEYLAAPPGIGGTMLDADHGEAEPEGSYGDPYRRGSYSGPGSGYGGRGGGGGGGRW